MQGDASGMLATTASALRSLGHVDAGLRFLQGCHAFGLEECGQLRAAELAGHIALEYEPADAWALHAVSHVHETQGRNEQGIDWLERTRPVWSRCNNLSFHMAWHLALLHVEQQRDGRRWTSTMPRSARSRPTIFATWRTPCRCCGACARRAWRSAIAGTSCARSRGAGGRTRPSCSRSLHYLMALWRPARCSRVRAGCRDRGP